VLVPISEAARAVMDLYPRIFFACHQRHVRDPLTRRLLSEHQANILAHLDEVSPLSLNSLSSHMGVTPGTMSVAVSRLVTMGYVRRKRDPQDARRLLLRLSTAGSRVRDAQSVLEPARVEEMLAHIPPVERQQAVAGLRVLAHAASRVAARFAQNHGDSAEPAGMSSPRSMPGRPD
jgi:DNA-binding MarR family transcriptional regulator